MNIRFMGESIPLAKLVQHYRMMARIQPQSAPFWRTRLRVVIATAREQMHGERLAA